MRSPFLRPLALFVGPAILAIAPGCACGSAPLVAPSDPGASAQTARSASVPPAPPKETAIARSSAESLLADPRLGELSALLDAGDPAMAAKAMERALGSAAPSTEDRARWLYFLGKLHTTAHHAQEAHDAYLAASQTSFALSSYASCAAASEAVRLGHHEEAIRLVKGAPRDEPESPGCLLTEAEAHEARGELDLALPIWRAYLDAEKRPSRWAEISLKTAKALLPTDPASALRFARRVAVEIPSGPLGARASEIEDAAARALPAGDPAARRTPGEELTRASALLDAGHVSDAERVVSAVEASLDPAAKKSVDGCRAASLGARIRGRRKDKGGAADAYGIAIDRCTADALPAALYQAGIASDKAGRPAEAMARYERLEREAKTSRFADDARVKGAMAALLLGDEARFSSMLERIGDDYPEGDSVGDGLFRLALQRIGRGDWASAVAPLETAIRLRPHDKEYWAAGRAPYFHARALWVTGEKERAKEEFRRVIADQPLTYYMALSYARLAEIDAGDAARALEDASHREPEGTLSFPDHPGFHTPGFLRALELLKQGDTDLAKAELAALGLTGPGAPAETEWVVAELYGRSGAFALAHTLPRGKLSDWLDHYPVGKWREAWEVAYPRPYPQVVAREAKSSGIPQSLAYAIMREESAFDAGVVSGADAYGLMQLILPTGKMVGKRIGLTVSDGTIRTPQVNIALGCRFLADLRGAFPGCTALAIPAYNAGPGAPKRWLADRPYDDLDVFVERIPYEETRNYTKRVLKSYLAYLYLYEPASLGEALRLPLRAKSMPAALQAPGAIGPETLVEEEP